MLVIAEGQTIYYGPRSEAQSYFEDLGFVCKDGANVADFLTGCTVPSERLVREDFKGQIPTSVSDFARRYRESEIGKRMVAELDEYLANQESIHQQTQELQKFVQAEKENGARKSQPQMVSSCCRLFPLACLPPPGIGQFMDAIPRCTCPRVPDSLDGQVATRF